MAGLKPTHTCGRMTPHPRPLCLPSCERLSIVSAILRDFIRVTVEIGEYCPRIDAWLRDKARAYRPGYAFGSESHARERTLSAWQIRWQPIQSRRRIRWRASAKASECQISARRDS